MLIYSPTKSPQSLNIYIYILFFCSQIELFIFFFFISQYTIAEKQNIAMQVFFQYCVALIASLLDVILRKINGGGKLFIIIIIIKRMGSLILIGWAKFQAVCKLLYKYTPLFTFVCCSATLLEPQPFLRNYIVWRKNNIITLYFVKPYNVFRKKRFIKAISPVKPCFTVYL